METHATGQVLYALARSTSTKAYKSRVLTSYIMFSARTGPGFAARPTSDTQACLQVISKEANFVTVRVNKADVTSTAIPERTDLLCSVRALLKKIKQTVLVGDNVQVASIDWIDKRGMLNCIQSQHKACTTFIHMRLLYPL